MEAIKARVREMEEEAEKLKMLQSEVEKQSIPQGVSKYNIVWEYYNAYLMYSIYISNKSSQHVH